MKGIFKMDYSNGITVFIGNEGFFEEEQVGLSDLMGTLRDAAEHKHDTRDNTHSHDIDAR